MWRRAAIVLALAVGLYVLWRDAPPEQADVLPLDPSPPATAEPNPTATGRSANAWTPPPSSSPLTPDPEPAPTRPPQTGTEAAPESKSGIGLFRPGTKPIKVGLVVPSGFIVPAGFMALTQVMDDGTQLPPILMYHPDNDGQNIPEDRIVRPDRAPAGMPIEMLKVPELRDPGEPD